MKRSRANSSSTVRCIWTKPATRWDTAPATAKWPRSCASVGGPGARLAVSGRPPRCGALRTVNWSIKRRKGCALRRRSRCELSATKFRAILLDQSPAHAWPFVARQHPEQSVCASRRSLRCSRPGERGDMSASWPLPLSLTVDREIAPMAVLPNRRAVRFVTRLAPRRSVGAGFIQCAPQ